MLACGYPYLLCSWFRAETDGSKSATPRLLGCWMLMSAATTVILVTMYLIYILGIRSVFFRYDSELHFFLFSRQTHFRRNFTMKMKSSNAPHLRRGLLASLREGGWGGGEIARYPRGLAANYRSIYCWSLTMTGWTILDCTLSQM